MAAKRKKSKKTHRRRRRMGAVSPALAQTGMLLAGAGAGAVIATFLNQAVKTGFTSLPPAAVGVGIAVVGGVLPLFIKTSPIIMGAAAGLAGMGIVFAVNESGALSLPGISGVPSGVPNARPAGYFNKSVGNAYSNFPGRQVGGNFSGNTKSAVAGILFN
jgi:hypothetical protein